MAGRDRQLCFDARFCGPPGMVNGGLACGAIEDRLGGAAEVTLRRPLPLARALTVHDGDGTLTVLDRGSLLVEARSTAARPDLTVPAVPAETVAAVAGSAGYFADPVFPDCFVCGMNRGPGDGLRIFPGPVRGLSVWAAPWTPDRSVADSGGRVRPEVVWAALDCPSGIAAAEAAELRADTAILLGRMTAPPWRRGPRSATSAGSSPGRTA